jgi:hypothetical protein
MPQSSAKNMHNTSLCQGDWRREITDSRRAVLRNWEVTWQGYEVMNSLGRREDHPEDPGEAGICLAILQNPQVSDSCAFPSALFC